MPLPQTLGCSVGGAGAWVGCSHWEREPCSHHPERFLPNEAAEQVQLFFFFSPHSARHVSAVGSGRGTPYLWKMVLAVGFFCSSWCLLKLYLVGDICGR